MVSIEDSIPHHRERSHCKKIDLDFLNLNGCYFGECYSFFIEQYEDKIIIIERGGEIKISSFNNLEVKNPKFQNLDSNLNFEYILDTLVHENEIFVTGKNIVGEKMINSSPTRNASIIKSLMDLNMFDKDKCSVAGLLISLFTAWGSCKHGATGLSAIA